MESIRISPENSAAAAAAAAEVIRRGGIVAFPTETYYGLGAAYDNAGAIGKLFGLKRRPDKKPVPLIAGNIAKLGFVTVHADKVTAAVMEAFWPGPLTLLLPAKEGLSRLLTGGTAFVAVRVPGPSFALELAQVCEFPFTATSANISGLPPAETAEAAADYFGKGIDLLIDGGRTPGGAPSTIISISDGEIVLLRKGRVPLESVLGVVSNIRGQNGNN